MSHARTVCVMVWMGTHGGDSRVRVKCKEVTNVTGTSGVTGVTVRLSGSGQVLCEGTSARKSSG